jgi:hypothetical protein
VAALLSGRKEAIYKGNDVYEVLSSCEVTTAKDLRKPKLEELRHIELTWEATSGSAS